MCASEHDDSGWLSLDQAARRLGVDTRTIRGWLRAGLLTGERRPGGTARLSRQAIDAFRDGRPHPSTGRLNRTDEHLCFGCGRLNPLGLRLSFTGDDHGVQARFTPGRLREGWAGATHGGILATLLDEVMAWSLFHLEIWAVTARLTITYRRPAPIGIGLVASAHVTRDRGRTIDVAGEVRDEAGELLAEAAGLFVRVSDAQRARLERTYGRRSPAPPRLEPTGVAG